MNCPNCGKELNENQKFCTHCGAKLNEDKNNNQLTSNAWFENLKQTIIKLCHNKAVIASIAALFIIIIGLITVFYFFKTNVDGISEYKSIAPYEKVQLDNMSDRVALDLMIEQDTDLTEFITKHPKANIDSLFEVFYKNLLTFSGKETELEGKLWYSGNDNYDNKDIKFQEREVKKKDYTQTVVDLIEPKTDLFKMLDECEGAFEAGINYNYLVSKYLSKLSEPWQDFLKIKQKEFNELDGYTYYTDGYPPSDSTSINRYLEETKFLKKYPDFTMNDVIQNDVKVYISEITGRTDILDSIFVQECGETSCKEPQINKELKQSYERFLKEADKDTEEYKFIKGLYEAIKKNNFKYKDDLYKVLIEITGDNSYEDWYGPRLEEKRKQEAIDNYKNYKFDKEEAYAAYQEASMFCEEEIKRTQNAGTGAFEGCVGDYLEKHNKKISKLYDLVFNYCSYTTDCEVDKRGCIYEEFNSFQND